MSHQQLTNSKYRNWVKAGLGFKYVKEGLEPFCDDIVKQQHVDILNNVKRKHNLTTVNCRLCNLRTLQPDHVRTRNKQCPLGQKGCNCQYPGGKLICPNNVCGAIYDEIIQHHASTPPAPYWRNTDAQLWCTEPWAVAKCFINAPGYTKKLTATEIDCSGLLHLLINNKGLQKHIHCTITGTDVFSVVRQHRNTIFHSVNMKVEDADVITYIDDMIDVLKDRKELMHRDESKAAVQKLVQLKQQEFVITTSLEAEIRAARSSLKELHEEVERQLKTYVEQKGSEIEAKVEQRGSDIQAKVEQRGSDIQAKMEQRVSDIQAEVEQKGSDIKAELENKGRELKQDIKESLCQYRETEQQDRYSEMKKELQTNLLKMYKDQVTQISALPLLPEEDLTDIVDVYVPPLMTVKIQNDRKSRTLERQSKTVEKQSRDVAISVHDIFANEEGKVVKLIYVLGEAGSGKSTFCKYLVSHWCAAHSENKYETIDTALVDEIRKFGFLFYISLRHCTDCYSIKMMLNEVYSDSVLDQLLQNDSGKCLIVLDGLDEWTPQEQKSSMFQTSGIPARDLSKDYTIITTSRPWKLSSLRIKRSEMHKTIKIKGIGKSSVNLLSKQTVDILNKRFSKSKDEYDFDRCIKNSKVSELCHVPMILQQLICLWFDEKLNDTSKCAVYSRMLELFFEWAAQKDPECHGEDKNDTSNEMADLQLPECLANSVACHNNSHAIFCLSHLAYETLFDRSKENALIFTASKLKLLKIPHDFQRCILRTGIVSEDRGVTLVASRRQKSTFSFVHKSIQEYLAAVYVAVKFENMTKCSIADEHNYDVKRECLLKYFGDCKTINDILDQSNVLTMLCVLKPHLASCISEYIYAIVDVDARVNVYRTTLKQDDYPNINDKLIANIQSCIIGCIKEMLLSGNLFQSSIYMGDIILKDISQGDDVLLALDKQVIISDNVTSLYIGSDTQYSESIINYLTTCKQLKALRYYSFGNQTSTIKYDEMIAKIVFSNVSTLTYVDLQTRRNRIVGMLLQSLSYMLQLTTLRIGGITGSCQSHEECISMVIFLEHSTRLQQILINIDCDHFDKHEVDLSNHKQLQCVDFTLGSFCITNLCIDKLVTCNVGIDNAAEMIKICDSLSKARNLQHLSLNFSINQGCNAVADWRTAFWTMTRLLPSLTSLSTLRLWNFTFADNIITRPSDMKNLKQIELLLVTMSITTWCKFTDSLPKLPQTVHVSTGSMTITQDDKEGHGLSWSTEETMLAAMRYVREKNVFYVTAEPIYDFTFTTKKE